MSYTFVTAICLAAPHVLYACVWYQPHIWRSQFKKDSVDVFAHVATALKGKDLLRGRAIFKHEILLFSAIRQRVDTTTSILLNIPQYKD